MVLTSSGGGIVCAEGDYFLFSSPACSIRLLIKLAMMPEITETMILTTVFICEHLLPVRIINPNR